MSDFDYQKLDDIIHSRLRLAIMAVLLTVETAEFTWLKKQINATDGNLSVNIRKLEEAGYITVTKSFINRKPSTVYQITSEGRIAFDKYLERLGKLIGK